MWKQLSSVLFVLALPAFSLPAAPWPDPAPPLVASVKDTAAPAPQTFDRHKFHEAPQPLAKGAVTSDWPRFLGPTDDAQSPESPLLHNWPATGPKLLWEVSKGNSYSSPVIVEDRLLVFHTLNDRETLECLHPETGQRYWVQDFPIEYRDKYGFGNGPRGSPVVADGCVVTLGITSVLSGYDLETGLRLWQRDLRKEFNVPQDFFGHGSSPLIIDGKVIVQVGGKAEPVSEDDTELRYAGLAKPGLSVGAFDLKTGKLLWGVKDEWGCSYASPIATKLHDREVVLLYAGGESSPATGGLFCLDPKDGTVLERFPWRADDYIQATGSSPVVIPGKNRVFISTTYPKGRPLGGVMVEFDSKLKARKLWESPKFAMHWMNPIHFDGFLYGINGETENNAELVCYDAEKGTEQWSQEVSWEDSEINPGRAGRLGIQRASLLQVDGKTLCLGETGTLLWLQLSPTGCQVESRAQLFYAPHAWCLPAVSKGLLYVMQNYEEQVRGKTGQRVLCYDLRSQ
jgi:outer membrane protein assembly factor BamB